MELPTSIFFFFSVWRGSLCCILHLGKPQTRPDYYSPNKQAIQNYIFIYICKSTMWTKSIVNIIHILLLLLTIKIFYMDNWYFISKFLVKTVLEKVLFLISNLKYIKKKLSKCSFKTNPPDIPSFVADHIWFSIPYRSTRVIK